MASGIFLGVKRTTSEEMAEDEECTYMVQSVQRVSIDRLWDGDLLMKIPGVPWNPVPKDDQITELPQPIVLEAELPDEPAEPTKVFAGVAGAPRKFYILKKYLDRVG